MLNFLNLKSKPSHLFWGVASSLCILCIRCWWRGFPGRGLLGVACWVWPAGCGLHGRGLPGLWWSNLDLREIMFNRHGYFQSRFSCRCGAHHVFNHNHKSYEKKMVEMLGGEGFDVIIEHLANINLGHDVQMLKNGARIMVVGCRGSVNINPRKYRLY